MLVGLVADFITIFLNICRDVALSVDVKNSVGVIFTSGYKCSFLIIKTLSILRVPGVVTVLSVGRTSFSIQPRLTISVVFIAVHRGPERGVPAQGGIIGSVGIVGRAGVFPLFPAPRAERTSSLQTWGW